MIVDTINEYLKVNRRLVIPTFGAFVVKDGGVIIFSELLKTDDGVLKGLLVSQGLREIEAAGKIDRFIFEVRHALMQGGICPVAELGTFHRSEDGIITFDSTKPAAVAVPTVPTEPTAPTTPVSPTTPTAPVTPTAPIRPVAPHSQTRSRGGKSPRRGGFVMWFAGIVIAGAILALAYGIYTMMSVPKDDIDAQMDALRIPTISLPTNE